MKKLLIAGLLALIPSAAIAHTWYVFDADTDACVTSKVLATQEGIPSLANPKSFIEWAKTKPWFQSVLYSKRGRGLSILYKHGEFSYWPGNDKKGCETYLRITNHYHLNPLSTEPNFPRGDASFAPTPMPISCDTVTAHA